MPKKQLTLFIPGLLDKPSGLEQVRDDDMPVLSSMRTLLSRARISPSSQQGYLPELFALFDCQVSVEEDLPVASISRLADKNREAEVDSFYLRADPVCLHADTQHAIMAAHASLQLSQQESLELVDSLNRFLKEDGLQLEIDNDRHWYLNHAGFQRLKTSPPHEVLGKNIEPHMPRGSEQAYWRRLLNEVQMLLHNHPVNLKRQQDGKLPVNSIWLWGAGKLPELNCHRWQCIVGNDPLYAGLARVTDTLYRQLPEHGTDLLQDDVENSLCIINTLLPAVVKNDIFAWLQGLQQLEQNWLQPLVAAIKQEELQTLTLMPANGKQYTLDRKALRRWWKRPASLPSLVHD